MVQHSARVLACAIALFSIAAAPAAFAQANCDRACLRTMLDQYLNAVIKHDPSSAPLFVGFRQTENAVVVRPGNGVWKTVTGLGKVQRRYFDPVSGQAAYFGIVEEGGATAIVTLRLKVESRRITEAEWIIARRGDAGLNGPPQGGQGGNLFDPDSLASNPPPERTIPREARASREALIAITNSYFDGITTHDGSIIAAHTGCSRIENGVLMTGARGGRGRGGAQTATRGGTPSAANADCTANLENINIQLVAARRYPVVDEEAGVVLAFAVFIRRPGVTARRNMLSEYFFIEDNKIRTIYAAMYYPPPEQPVPNWPPYDGNWPMPSPPAPSPAQ